MEKQIIESFYFLYISTSIDIEKMVGLEPNIWYLRKRERRCQKTRIQKHEQLLTYTPHTFSKTVVQGFHVLRPATENGRTSEKALVH